MITIDVTTSMFRYSSGEATSSSVTPGNKNEKSESEHTRFCHIPHPHKFLSPKLVECGIVEQNLNYECGLKQQSSRNGQLHVGFAQKWDLRRCGRQTFFDNVSQAVNTKHIAQ